MLKCCRIKLFDCTFYRLYKQSCWKWFYTTNELKVQMIDNQLESDLLKFIDDNLK